MRAPLGLLIALTVSLAVAGPAAAGPVATSDPEYMLYGRVFPDALGGCQAIGSPCDPAAEGNLPATTFIGINEFHDALVYMNSKPEWQRYLEVLILDGKEGDGANDKATVTADPGKMFPGDNLPPEFAPNPRNVSAGLAQPDLSRRKSDLTVLRVTDETVPDTGKKRMTLSLSIHGIERAGAEGGTRAMEDLVTAVSSGKADQPVVGDKVRADAPTFADVLKKTIIYFTYPNPDGWRRGTVDSGGLNGSFQRYNGNGIDPNRDYTDIGYSFRGYTGDSEPETQAFKGFYGDLLGGGADFQAGDDLHGQPEADALSYTLLPHGSHDLAKDTRIRETAKAINRAQFEATKWSPIIKDNDEVSTPQDVEDGCTPEAFGVGAPNGTTCPQIFAQTWGSVYDTINYTTAGATGDFFDSNIGLDADGIDNEMSFSHIDKQIVFERQTEQLHIAGNKAIIFTHVADILNPVTGSLDAPGPQGYVPNLRVKQAEKANQPGAPANTVAQADIDDTALPAGTDPDDVEFTNSVLAFEVKRTEPASGQPGIFNGGMRIKATTPNIGGTGNPETTLRIQCRHCDDHVGAKDADEGEWITVAEDFNQSPIYAQAGLDAAVNLPDALYTDSAGKVKPVEWRAVIGVAGVLTPGPAAVQVEFSSGPASDDGNTNGDAAPVQRAYDVANTDFFSDLNKYIPEEADRFQAIDPKQVIAGTQSLGALHTLVLADAVLPGYVAPADVPTGPTGTPTANKTFAPSGMTKAPAQGADSCPPSDASSDYYAFTIPAADANGAMHVEITWSSPTTDYDLYVQRKVNGTFQDVGVSNGGPTVSEKVDIANPPAGDYRIATVYCIPPVPGTDDYAGTVTFDAVGAGTPPATADSLYTKAEFDTWIAKLREYAAGGGNLVLTDAALNGLADLLPDKFTADQINRQTVYTGQVTVTRCKGYEADGSCTEEEQTLADPLNKNLNQPGSRFNSGFRRQIFEPTPLGFAIQSDTGGDESNARQYDVDAKAFADAGGRVVNTSADDGARDAVPVVTRATVGELPVGDKGGHIRIAGALLPQPTEDFDHPLGLVPYATTYSGYILACNLLYATCAVKLAGTGEATTPPSTPSNPSNGTDPANPGGSANPAGSGTPGGPATSTPPASTPSTPCVSRSGFNSVRVTPSGAGLRFAFTRKVKRPVTVEVFQTTRGRTLLGNHRVVRFQGKTKGFAWDGAGARSDGLYFARFKLRGAKGALDVRRVSLRRENGTFRSAPSGYRRAQCSLLRAFKLRFGAFGGRRGVPLAISFRLRRSATVAVAVTRRGGATVKRFRARKVAGGRTYRLSLPAAGLARGDYVVRLVGRRGAQSVTARLTARRL